MDASDPMETVRTKDIMAAGDAVWVSGTDDTKDTDDTVGQQLVVGGMDDPEGHSNFEDVDYDECFDDNDSLALVGGMCSGTTGIGDAVEMDGTSDCGSPRTVRGSDDAMDPGDVVVGVGDGDTTSDGGAMQTDEAGVIIAFDDAVGVAGTDGAMSAGEATATFRGSDDAKDPGDEVSEVGNVDTTNNDDEQWSVGTGDETAAADPARSNDAVGATGNDDTTSIGGQMGSAGTDDTTDAGCAIEINDTDAAALPLCPGSIPARSDSY